MEKKIGLEHAIRKVLAESIGGPNTDEFKGTPSAFLKPVGRITPPNGEKHPNSDTELAKRARAKISSSETMKKEENLEEQTKKKEEEEGESWDPASETTSKKKSDKDKVVGGNLPPGMKPSGELTSREPLPTEAMSAELEKLYGGGREARERIEKIAKAASALTFGATDIAGSALDSTALAKQGEYKKAAKEFTTGVALPLAGGYALGRFGSKVIKQADQAVMSPVPKQTTTAKPAEVEVPKAAKPAEVEAPKTDVAPTKTGGTEPPVTTTKLKYQPFAGKPRSSVNVRSKPLGTQAREPSSTASTSSARSGARTPLSPEGGAGVAKPPNPRGGGGGGGGGTQIQHPSAPENVVSIKPPTDTTPSNATVAQLKTAGGAKPAPKAPEPVKPAPVSPGPSRRGAPQRDVPWRKAPPAKPAAPKPEAPPETPKVPGMPEFKPFDPNKPFKPKTPANDPINKPPAKQPSGPPAPFVAPPVTTPAPVAPVVAPPDKKTVDKPKPSVTPKPGNRPDIGPTQQPSSQPAAAPVTAPAAAPVTAPAAAPAIAPNAAAAAALAAANASGKTTKQNKNEKSKEQKQKEPLKDKLKRLLGALGGLGGAAGGGGGAFGSAPVSTFTHFPIYGSLLQTSSYQETRGLIEDADSERESIENVARPNSNRKKATKQAEIIRKIIDEQKLVAKKKKSSTVEINPTIKNPDEGSK
jgi:hypothetical protein